MFGINGIVILIIITGVFLLALEIFVIPGLGITGILGIAFLIVGIFLVASTPWEGILYTAIALFAGGIAIYLSFRSPRTRKIWRRFSLTTRQTQDEGYVGPKKVENESYLGRVGVSLTLLRPAGTADFDGEYLDVVTEGGFIDAKKRVKIIAIEGTRIVVREEPSSGSET